MWTSQLVLRMLLQGRFGCCCSWVPLWGEEVQFRALLILRPHGCSRKAGAWRWGRVPSQRLNPAPACLSSFFWSPCSHRDIAPHVSHEACPGIGREVYATVLLCPGNHNGQKHCFLSWDFLMVSHQNVNTSIFSWICQNIPRVIPLLQIEKLMSWEQRRRERSPSLTSWLSGNTWVFFGFPSGWRWGSIRLFQAVLENGPGWGAGLQRGPAMVGSTTVQSREAGFLPPRSHMGRTHLQAVATAGPGAELTTPLTPASLWDRGCGCARVGWRGSSVTLLWTPTVLVPLSIPALNSLNYDCLSLCLPIGLWAPWEQRLHLFISIPGRQYSWLAQRNCSVNVYWTNGGETWLPQVDCLPGPYHNLLSSIRCQAPMLLPAHGPFLTACWSLTLWPVPREGLAPGDRGKESIDRAMWMSTTSRFGGGERMAWIIVSRMWRGTVWVTHSSCFHLKLISKYHYKWTLNLKQNSMETNHSESF